MQEKIPDMLTRFSQIFLVGEESVVTSAQQKKEKENSEALTAQMSSWLWTKAGIELCKEVLVLIQYFQTEEGMKELAAAKKEIAARALPKDAISAKLTPKMSLAALYLSIIDKSSAALAAQDIPTATAQFKDLATLLSSLKPQELPSYLQEKLNQSLDSFLLQGPRGKTAGDLLFLISLATKADSFKKEGLSGEMLQEKIESMIEGLSMNGPSSPFASIAENWLNLPTLPTLVQRLAASPTAAINELTEEFSTLVAQIQSNPEAKLSLAASRKCLADELKPDNQYNAYLKIFEEETEKNQLEEVIKNINLATLKNLPEAFKPLLSFDPSLTTDLDKLNDLLNRNLPTTLKDLSTYRLSITSLIQKFSQMLQAGQVDPETRRLFFSKMKEFFESILQPLEENQLSCQQKALDNETAAQEIKEGQAQLSHFDQTLAPAKEGGSLSFSAVQENCQSLFDLIANYRIQSNDAKEPFTPFFDTLSTVTCQDTKFSHVVASAATTHWLREFSRSHPGGSLDHFKRFMASKLASLNEVAPTHPFLGELQEHFKKIESDPSFPLTKSAFGPTYTKEEETVLAPNSALPKAIEERYTPPPQHIAAIHRATSSSIEKLTIIHERNWAKARAMRSAFHKTSETKRAVDSARINVIYKDVATESMPDRFMNIIMNYMSGETQYLMAFAELLYAYNDGVNTFDSIANIMTPLQDAGTNLDFTSFLSSNSIHNTNYYKNGSKATQLSNFIQTAQASAIGVMGSLQLLLNGDGSAAHPPLHQIIQNLIDKRDQHPVDDEVYKTYDDMIKQLQPLDQTVGTTPVLQLMINHVQAYYSYISSFSVQTFVDPTTQQKEMFILVPDPAGGTTYMNPIELQNLLSAAVDGDEPNYPSLNNLYTLFNTEISNYSNLNQNQTVRLQMEMTKTGQEWGIVGACFSLLVKMYMFVARNLKN